MPDNSRIDSLEAILAEKRKHEGFLEKLEGRRASTPEHVFARLRDEYLTKLTDLQVRASMEAETLGEGLIADEEALQAIEERLAAVTEEKIEGELRAEVGEYEPNEWKKKLNALNASISIIEKERASKSAAFERTRALLTEARPSAAIRAIVEPTRALAPALAPAPAPAAPPPRQAAPAAPPTRTSSPTPPPARAEPPAPQVRQTPAGPTTSVQVPLPPAPPQRASTPVRMAEPFEDLPGANKAPPAAAPMQGGPSFDELAFLNSVVGRTSAQRPAPPAETDGRTSDSARSAPPPAAPAAPPVQPGTPVAPIIEPGSAPPKRASVVAPAPIDTSNDGPLGRPTPRTSQAIKTLKCQECGTLNYPTEWYCERCGGELAAL